MTPLSLVDPDLPFRGAGTGRPEILLVGFDGAWASALEARLRAGTIRAEGVEQALAALQDRRVAAVCIGPGLQGDTARALVQEMVERRPDPHRRHLVLAAGGAPERFSALLARDALFFLTREPPELPDLAALLDAALDGPEPAELPAGLDRLDLDALAQRLARAGRPEEVLEVVRHALAAAVEADEVDAFLHRPDAAHGDVLWSPGGLSSEARRESPAAGLVAFAARTGRTVAVERPDGDPRFDPELDAPRRGSAGPLLAVPTPGGPGAVLVARREAGRPGFSRSERRLGEVLARQAGAALARTDARRFRERARAGSGPFRVDALEHHARGLEAEGRTLAITPRWMRSTSVLLAAFLAAGAAWLALGTADRYVAGSGVVRLGGRTPVTAPASGTVTEVVASPGARVESGDLLVRFHGAREAAELERIRRELELAVADRLFDPDDRPAARSVAALRAELDLARARAAERTLVAPVSGTVSELRVRPGVRVEAGDLVASVATGRGEPEVVALLPGRHRPLLEAGQPLHFDLPGFPPGETALRVSAVGAQVLGVEEARRLFGPGAAVPPASEPVVVVRARLPAETFTAGGTVYRYHDGMQGRVEVRVGSERLLTSLLPAAEGGGG